MTGGNNPWTLREDFSGEELRSVARNCTDERSRGRLLAIASIYDGVAPGDVARIWGISAPSMRQLLERFNDDGVEGLSDRPTSPESPRWRPDS
jgi:transposase